MNVSRKSPHSRVPSRIDIDNIGQSERHFHIMKIEDIDMYKLKQTINVEIF